jgi:hypothetical protein
MPRKSKAFLARSAAAKLGWQRRRRAEQKEFKRRSEAAKKAWITRRSVSKRPVSKRPVSKQVVSKQVVSKRPVSKLMWRVTVSAPYYRRAAKPRRGSISSSYMVRGWYRTKREAQKALNKLTELAISGRDEILDSDMNTWWTGDNTVNTDIKSVPYDERFLDTIEEQNEEIR